LNAKKKLKQCDIAENIDFWTWINATKLALVTPTSIWHVDITTPGTNADKIFD